MENLIEWDIETSESIPRSQEWYAKEPFNPSLIVFKDNEGREWRYMNSPLDERYLVEPGDSYISGSIPPEEREVRDTLLATVLYRNKVTRFDFWWSQFFKPTESYSISLDYFRRLSDLCGRSQEYRAAFCRLANSEGLNPGIRQELERIISMCNKNGITIPT